MPRGSRRLDPRWRYRTKEGDAALAIDGDMRTGWTVSRPLKGDEFFEVVFDHPIPVAGLVLRLGRDSMFPTRFRIGCAFYLIHPRAPVLLPLSVGEMTLRLYAALNYSQNGARDLRRTLNGV